LKVAYYKHIFYSVINPSTINIKNKISLVTILYRADALGNRMSERLQTRTIKHARQNHFQFYIKKEPEDTLMSQAHLYKSDKIYFSGGVINFKLVIATNYLSN
jgi:hypothetical protein